MIDFVVDASVLVELTLGQAPAAELRRQVVAGRGGAPEMIDLEVLSVLRRLWRAGAIEREDAQEAARAFADAPLVRVPHRPLLDRVWQLRDVLTAYDAAYVALAELSDTPLLTCDARLGRTAGHQADVVLFPGVQGPRGSRGDAAIVPGPFSGLQLSCSASPTMMPSGPRT